MTKPSGYLTGASIALGLLCAPAAAKFVTFQPPGATITTPKVIANSGEVIGYFVDQSGVTHGFLRAPDGTFTTMDVPGATTTVPLAINDSGTIVGTYTVEAERRAALHARIYSLAGWPDNGISGSPRRPRHECSFDHQHGLDCRMGLQRQQYKHTDFGFLQKSDPAHFTKFGPLAGSALCTFHAHHGRGSSRRIGDAAWFCTHTGRNDDAIRSRRRHLYRCHRHQRFGHHRGIFASRLHAL